MQSFKALFQEAEISSLINRKPSDSKDMLEVLDVARRLVANGIVRTVVKGYKPGWHNLVLTKSMFLSVAF